MRNNDSRANAAAKALDAYTTTNTPAYSEESIEDRVGDLICDLLHLVRRDSSEEPSIDEPIELLDRARSNFEEEEEEENGGEEGTDTPDDTDSLEDRGISLGSYES